MEKVYFKELISELKQKKLSKEGIAKLKRRLAKKHKMDRFPTDIEIFLNADASDIKYLKQLQTKPTRSLSGVAVIAVMTKPLPCPHGKCAICPGGPSSVFGDVPQSYTGKEPATMRALRAGFDPYLQVFNRLEQYIVSGHVPDKVELIVMGGTFPSFPKPYRDEFVKYCFKAMNDFSGMFFDEDKLDIAGFKDFFELPGKVGDKKRTESIQAKLMRMRDIDISKMPPNLINLMNDKESAAQVAVRRPHSQSSCVLFATPKGATPGSSHATAALDEAGDGCRAKRAQLGKSQIFRWPYGLPSKAANEVSRPSSRRSGGVLVKQKSVSLETEQKNNETSKIRCIGLTIETRPDYAKLQHANEMLRLGCTRVELGVQSVYDEILEKMERGHSVKDSIEATEILKDLGFKINYHYMLGLPGSNPIKDLIGLNRLFLDANFKPDMLKIYPCMVVKGTKLHGEWKKGNFRPLTTRDAAEIIIDFKKNVPEYVRIMRVQRDIPTYMTEAGVDRTNLRQLIQQEMARRGIRCRCIRCREIGRLGSKDGEKGKAGKTETKVIAYNASKGIEFFISENKGEALLGFCRMRFPHKRLRKEITKDSALIRELHVYGETAAIGSESSEGSKIQHKGIGRKLLKNAEQIAKKHGMKKMVVISGVGAREYYKKLSYKMEGVYMVRRL